MVKLTVVGSLNYDLITYTQRVPDAGETFKADSFETHIGGKGLNQTISIARLIPEINEQYKVRIVGNVGDDSFGVELLKALEDHGVDVSDVGVLKDQASGVATILVEKSTGENRILIAEAANGKTVFNDDQLEELFPKDSTEDEIVVFQNEIPGTLNIIQWLKANRSKNTQIVYNPSPYYSYSTKVIDLIDILIVNEIESMAIAKDVMPIEEYELFAKLTHDEPIEGFSKLAQNLKQKVNQLKSNLVIITLGPLGSIVTLPSFDKTAFIKPVKVEKVIDTTGAGDTFLGALLTQICLGVDIKEATEFASFASSMAIQKNGASNSIPRYKEVIAKRAT